MKLSLKHCFIIFLLIFSKETFSQSQGNGIPQKVLGEVQNAILNFSE
jgi:hypothetical protein